ncbi:hypothetical protein EVAR_103329_1 [Eumeta japonica]|uniref:Uncharacterized protein n=1 Tax=Eumeta variegata TaxID=151549 RepID=A0A4C1Z6E3_EUMVA|nr:hypothetical protein EVAR_103329_1 [Eumeta japonica]
MTIQHLTSNKNFPSFSPNIRRGDRSDELVESYESASGQLSHRRELQCRTEAQRLAHGQRRRRAFVRSLRTPIRRHEDLRNCGVISRIVTGDACAPTRIIYN